MSATGRKPFISPVTAGVISGIVIAAIVFVMFLINVNFAAPWGSYHTLTARVSDADGIAVSSDVRIAGRLVGQVTDVRSKGQCADTRTNQTTECAEVSFHVDDSEWPIPRDSNASIRLATLLGQKYLEIEPGTSKDAMPENGVFQLDQTHPVVDFDQILDGFDQTTRDKLTSLLRTAGSAVEGQQGTIQALVPSLRGLNSSSQKPTGVLATRDPELNGILVNLATTADQLDASREDLAGFIDNLNHVLGNLASHPSALPSFIASFDKLNLTTVATLGAGGAQQLNAGLQRLPAAASQLSGLLTTLVPETQGFFSSGAESSALKLVIEIGDAVSQSDRDGHFLRQNLQGVDLCGVIRAPGVCNISGGAPAAGAAPLASPAAPSAPTLPTPPINGAPGLPGGSNGSGSGSGSGSGGGSGGGGGQPACLIICLSGDGYGGGASTASSSALWSLLAAEAS